MKTLHEGGKCIQIVIFINILEIFLNLKSHY